MLYSKIYYGLLYPKKQAKNKLVNMLKRIPLYAIRCWQNKIMTSGNEITLSLVIRYLYNTHACFDVIKSAIFKSDS